jgi:hypothetical protein
MKKITLRNADEAYKYIEAISTSASSAQVQLLELSKNKDSIQFLRHIKFEQIGFDPLDPKRKLNLIEQVNQTFTYLASFKAADIIFNRHPNISELSLNLGNISGTDIESTESGGIAAEVFAATRPGSNNKLNKDIVKVAATQATHKYVFLMCPNIEAGHYQEKSTNEVMVWSLGMDVK